MGGKKTHVRLPTLYRTVQLCQETAHSTKRPCHSAVDVEVDIFDKHSQLLHSVAVSIPNTCSQRVHITTDDNTWHHGQALVSGVQQECVRNICSLVF